MHTLKKLKLLTLLCTGVATFGVLVVPTAAASPSRCQRAAWLSVLLRRTDPDPADRRWHRARHPGPAGGHQQPAARADRDQRQSQRQRHGDLHLQPGPGAVAYRAFKNGQALQWIDDWGQPSFLVTDSAPCQNANYQVYAMSADNTDPSAIGQISTAYRVGGDNQLAPYSIPSGTTFTYTITSYNDGGQTALGYNAGLGFCAVDARTIPWGTRFTVPGYGSCYAADIGDWIEGSITDVWLPGGEANNWGVQQQTITIN